MTIFVQLILIASLLAGCCSAQTSTFKVLPWNNHVAALSLTFDDSRAVHLDVVGSRTQSSVICAPHSSSSFPRPPGWTIGAGSSRKDTRSAIIPCPTSMRLI